MRDTRGGDRFVVRGLVRSFYLLQLAALLNAVGARCGQLAIAWWILHKTGDALLFSASVAIATFADVLSRALCGWLGDEYDRQRLLASFPSVSWSVAHSPRRWAQAQPWQCSAC
ncbi:MULTISPECIES: hypothetical protein [unclassified Pseudomonas]|uniref:hypothetical protein n=1 Tax=unclassified Pseudomonas TaxID=196821 RepID=UPI000A1E467E|nr:MULTISPECIES: hypothetical protein [unclassified Pseudomonas]POA55145.1 hypothetical protein C1889_14365 [Pseudomonas sp. FW507-12TSA]